MTLAPAANVAMAKVPNANRPSVSGCSQRGDSKASDMRYMATTIINTFHGRVNRTPAQMADSVTSRGDLAMACVDELAVNCCASSDSSVRRIIESSVNGVSAYLPIAPKRQIPHL